ncbi:MAG: hypothetical protein IBJ05_09300, partial [Blastomonas sp.]|nr:hypothetical protein [Blastomonas sp.]
MVGRNGTMAKFKAILGSALLIGAATLSAASPAAAQWHGGGPGWGGGGGWGGRGDRAVNQCGRAAEIDIAEEKVLEALLVAAEPLSLSEPLREDGDAELGDLVEDRSAVSPFDVAATAMLPQEVDGLL